MSYFVRLNLIFVIILFSVILNATAAQTTFNSEVTPSLKRVIINGDSIIFIIPVPLWISSMNVCRILF